MLSFHAFVLVTLTTVVFYCDSASIVYTITFQQYTAIQIGWTQQQVTNSIGSAGNVVIQVGTGSISFLTLEYTGSQSPFSLATFNFEDGILASKSQVGLDTGVYTITFQQYTAIQIGWTQDQVTNLVGSAGSAVLECGTGNTATVIVQYTAAGTTFGIVDLGFVGGNLVSKSEIGFDSTVNNTITLQQYTTIQIGWTQQQVTQLLGGSGNILVQAGSQGSPYQITIIQYTGSQSSFSLATFNFQGGILTGKSQIGLDTGVYTMTQQQYQTIQIGWTQQQVTSLVGSAGSAVSESGTGSTALVVVQYTQAGNSFSIADLGFVGGSLVSKSEIGFDSTVNNTITLQQYTTIQIGWTQQQVTQLLGSSGNILVQVGSQGSPYQITIIQYTGPQSSFSSATFNFQGGILTGKSQIGLDTGVYTMTQQQYTTIQIGWTQQQVTNLVGSAGNAVSESGTGSTALIVVQYTEAGNPYGIVDLGFVGGQLQSIFETGFK